MKSVGLLMLAGLASALPQAPTPPPKPAGAPAAAAGNPNLAGLGGFDFAKSTAEDLNGPCREFLLVIARGSLEPGNIGVTTGPKVCEGLRKRFGDKVGCQGVDPKAYSAAIQDNGNPKGTTEASINAGVQEYQKIYQKCPNTKLVFTGYSQGAAVMHNAIPLLSADIKKQIIGGALFGDTRNTQSNSSIEGIPKENLVIFCDKDDNICWAKRGISAGHLAYLSNGDIDRAINFLASKIEAAGGK